MTASGTHRALYNANTLIERTRLVPHLDARELAMLLGNAHATSVDTHVIDGLIVAISGGRPELVHDRHEIR